MPSEACQIDSSVNTADFPVQKLLHCCVHPTAAGAHSALNRTRQESTRRRIPARTPTETLGPAFICLDTYIPSGAY